MTKKEQKKFRTKKCDFWRFQKPLGISQEIDQNLTLSWKKRQKRVKKGVIFGHFWVIFDPFFSQNQ